MTRIMMPGEQMPECFTASRDNKRMVCILGKGLWFKLYFFSLDFGSWQLVSNSVNDFGIHVWMRDL